MADLKERILEKASYGDYKRFYGQYFDPIGKMDSSGNCKVKCCFHEETDGSLSLNLFNGQYFCFGCGAKGDHFEFYQKKEGVDFKESLNFFAEFLNIDVSDNGNGSGGPASAKPKKVTKGEIECTYDYVNLSGEIVHQVVRYRNPKSFSQRRPDKDNPGKFIWNLKGVELLPFNLPEVEKSKTVYIVEGEKDVLKLKEIGLVGSCNAQGAGKWPLYLSEYFRDKEIIILPDNDKPGKDHAQLVANKLSNIAESIKIIELPGLQPSGDFSDWMDTGKTKDDLLSFIKEQELSSQYESHIEYLNKKHAAIMVGGRFLIMNQDYDPIFKRSDISFSPVNDFLMRYKNRKIPNPNAGIKGQPKEIGIAKDWLESPDRLQYSKLVFDPSNNVPPEYYNLWQGMAVESKKGNWELYRNHIYNVIAAGDKFIGDWIITWMARIVQDPGGKRPGTAIVLRGEQGVGKGIFLSTFGQIFGKHFLQINNQKQLVSQYNNHMKDALFLFVDEGFWAGDKSGEGIIKGFITEDIICIEPKGKDIIIIKNHVNIAMASNSEWVNPAGFGERRFFTMDVSNEYKGNIPYFKAIEKQMQREGGKEAMVYDLLQWDITKINIKKFPQTNAGIEQLTASISPIQQFWYEKLRDGNLLSDPGGWDYSVNCGIFYNEYIKFCNDMGVRRRHAPTQFGKELRIVCPGIERIRVSDSVTSRPWHYYFPNLETCRNDFIRLTGASTFDWEYEKIIEI